MLRTEATEQYAKALKLGQKEYKDRLARGFDPHPQVLSELIGEIAAESCQYVGQTEIPAERIVGTKSAGRVSAFTATFLPLLEPGTEFSAKWINLCVAHLDDEGIRDPIVCYEYLGDFYVQEGNKRVSVLRSYDAPRIPSVVYRVQPPAGDSPRLKAYGEFLDFYAQTGLYDLQYTTPGCYAKLTAAIGIPADTEWTSADRKRFRASFQYFREAFFALGGHELTVSPEEALLLWLKLYPYEKLSSFSSRELKETLGKMWENVVALEAPAPVVRTEPPADKKAGILSKLTRPDYVNVAFVHQRTSASSPWTLAHDAGRRHLEEVLGDKVVVRSYFGADSPEHAETILEQAAAEGAQVVFTTTPQLMVPSLKLSVKYPYIRVLNCSIQMPYSSVRSYYSRIFEGKFITGAIAGAMAENDRIGYVGTYPIHGEPAAINAFALGAQMTNPRAVVELKWSCQAGNPTREFLDSGIRVISNRDTPMEDRLFTEYGTYIYNENGKQTPLGSPVWRWGKFYENVVRSVLTGTFNDEKVGTAINYWWGMDSGVIDVTLSDSLPAGIRYLAQKIREDLQSGTLDPFRREVFGQDGTLKHDGTRALTPEELLNMDWLCENVRGMIPKSEEVLAFARPTVELLGVFAGGPKK